MITNINLVIVFLSVIPIRINLEIEIFYSKQS